MMKKTNIDAIQASFATPITKEKIQRELEEEYQKWMKKLIK